MAASEVSTGPPLPPEAFDLGPDDLWFLHCAEGPVPLAAARVVREFLRKETRPWLLGWKEDFVGIPAAARAEAAHLLGARPQDVSLTPTTSSGIATVAQTFPFEPGDEVLAPLGEFPANVWPWRALEGRGVRWREVALWEGHRAGARAWESAPPEASGRPRPEERLLGAAGPRTRVVAASWVRFQDGLRLDLQRLARGCRKRGLRLVVDGIQGAGTVPVRLAGVDAFATGGHKGLLAPQGLGFLWTSPTFRGLLRPGGSWLSVEDAGDFSRPSTDLDRGWMRDGTRFEQGVPNLLGAVALTESLRLLNRAGAKAIFEHTRRLEGLFLEGMRSLGGWPGEASRLAGLQRAGRLGSIVALHHGGLGPEGLERVLAAGRARGIHASVREGYLRIAFHGWHREGDVGRLLDWLAGV